MTTSFFFLRGPHGAANGQDSWGFFKDVQALDGWMLVRAPASPTQGLHHHEPRYFNFPYFCVALRNIKKGKRGACQQKAATVLPNRTAAA